MPNEIQEILFMHTDTFEVGGWGPATSSASHLNVVIAYADFSSASMAKRILHDAIAVLSSHFVVDMSFWKFELLQSSTLQEMAMQDAARAQIIVIAAEKEYGLPDGAKKWVEACLTNPEVKDVAFVALLRDEAQTDEDSSPLLDGFDHFASGGKTDFFWFIANENHGQRLAAEKIIQLACHMPVIDGMECVG
jgi:hypothetical protein